MTEEWGKLKGYPSAWGTTAKDRMRIIQEPSLQVWSVFGDAFAPTLTHKEEDGFGKNEEVGSSLIGMPLLSTRQRWEEDSSDEEPGYEDEPPLLGNSRGSLEGLDLEEVDPPPNMDVPFEWEAPDLKDG
jgi:hypothetical protein